MRRRWWYLLPAVFITYSLAYLDRANYGLGSAAGLARSLHITDKQNSLLATLFFLGYFIFQVPGAALARKHSPTQVVFVSLIIWGALASLTGIVHQFWLLAADRFLLGIAESIVFPAMLFLVTQWFTRSERSRANTALILGNPLTVLWMSAITGYLIKILGWQKTFIVEGIPAICWAMVWILIARDRPSKAAWITSEAAACFPVGNLAPDGCVIKSTAIDPSLMDQDNVYRHTGPARVFIPEAAAIHAIKLKKISQSDVIALICSGPLGADMQEIYQITSALKNLPFCRQVAVLTDARFSGVSTGACIGHISPEALAGGPIGRLREGDIIEIVIDRNALRGAVNFIGEGEERFSLEECSRRLAARPLRPDLAPHPALPDDTRLWAALIQASGGVWGGCVYDTDHIVAQLTFDALNRPTPGMVNQ